MDNFQRIAQLANTYADTFELHEVPDIELPEHGEPGAVVLVARSERRLRRLVSRARAADAAETEDLQQAAIVGYLDALRRFDPERGTEPFTHAQSNIIKALQEANRAASPKPAKQATHDRFWRAMDATDNDPVRAREWSRLQRLTGHALLEEADNGNTLAADILDARIARYERKGLDVDAQLSETGRGLDPDTFDAVYSSVTYLDAPLSDAENDAGTLHEVVADEDAQAPVADVEDRLAVMSLLSTLDERERSIISGLYGIGGVEKTAMQLADEHGVSRPRVLNIRKAALKKLAKVAA